MYEQMRFKILTLIFLQITYTQQFQPLPNFKNYPKFLKVSNFQIVIQVGVGKSIVLNWWSLQY